MVQAQSAVEVIPIYEAYTLTFANKLAQRVRGNFLSGGPPDGPMPLDYNMWLIRNKNRVVLVDTGYNAAAAQRRNRPLSFDPVSALEALGIPADQVDHIIITHLHFDHAGNLGRFPNATFHVQEAEVSFATGPAMQDRHLCQAYDVADVLDFVRANFEGRVVFYDGDAEIFPGISVHLLPGHSHGMQAVRVNTARGPVVIASDVVHYYANLLLMIPFGVTVDSHATLRSFRRLLSLAGGVERIIPGHDPRIKQLYPTQLQNGIQLVALHEEPARHDKEILCQP